MPGRILKDLQLKNSLKLFALVQAESLKQIDKWGVQEHDPFEWLAYTTEEHGEVSKAISEWYYRFDDPNEVVIEAIQEATLAIKIAEMFIEVTRLTKVCQKTNNHDKPCYECIAYKGNDCFMRQDIDPMDVFDPLES